MGLLNRIRRNLAEFIKPEEKRHALSAPRLVHSSLPKPRVEAASDFTSQLAAILGQAGSNAVHAGRINLIGLEHIKERFGANWSRIADRADRIARSTVERHLVPGDIYTAVQGTNYLIVFGSLSRQDAQIKCRLMAGEIAKMLLGEEGASDLDVRTAVAKLDGTLGFATVPSIDELLSSPAFDELPVAAHGRGQFAVAEELEAVPINKPAPAPLDIVAAMRFAYRPMWSPAHNVISAYLCVPLVPTSDVGPVYGEAELALGNDSDEIARFDFAVLNHLLAELGAMVRERRRLLVAMPVHFETLSSSMRRHVYAKELAAGITPDMANLLVIELIGVPDGVLQSRMVELVAPLRPHCRATAARVRLELGEFTAFKDVGFLSIGCDIADSSGSELFMMQRMGRFTRAAEKAGLGTHVRGVRSLSLLGAALGAGFRYVDGDVVSPLVDRPRQVLKFSLGDAYRSLVAK